MALDRAGPAASIRGHAGQDRLAAELRQLAGLRRLREQLHGPGDAGLDTLDEMIRARRDALADEVLPTGST